jgi:lysophospholipase
MNDQQHMPVDYRQGKTRAADEVELAWQAWTPFQPRGLIIVVHGLAEHGGRYRQTAERLASRGWAVYAGDLRGHGKSSDGRKVGRVHVDTFGDYFLDVEAIAGLALADQGDLPLILLGHSMGGLIALSYALEKPGKLAGAIISSPVLGTHPDFQPPRILQLLVGFLSRIAPRLLVKSELDANAISRDPAVVRAYLADPLVSKRVSTRWYSVMVQAMEHAHGRAGTLSLPMLLMQSGSDRLVDPAATARWAAAAPARLVEFVQWDGLYHEMLNEPEKEEVLARVLAWLDQQVPGL